MNRTARNASAYLRNLKRRRRRLSSSDEAVTDVSQATLFAMAGQQIDKAWFQEDLVDGAVTSWLSRGRRPTTVSQLTPANQPSKLASEAGVYFANGATKNLQSAVDLEAPYSHRWWLVIARANLASGSPTIVDINGNSTSQTTRQPRISFTGVTNKMNTTLYDTSSKALQGDCSGTFTDWNVLIGGRRGTKAFSRVNAGTMLTTDFLGFRPNNVASPCVIGSTSAMPADMAIDCIIIGDGELTDRQIEALEAWACWRVSRQSLLVTGLNGAAHPFIAAAPVAADFVKHNVFEFDQATWDAWVTAGAAVRFNNRGLETYSEAGYSRVFFTDFDLADQVPVSDLTGTANSPWFAPGWLTTLDAEASLVQSSGQPWPLAYVQDTSATAGGVGRPGTLALHMYNDGAWKSGAMYSVNNNGAGRTWGKGIFKVRCKFVGVPALSSPFPGLFPAPLWAYAVEHILQRTRNRIEPDFIELTGKDSSWNEGSLHIHEPEIAYPSDLSVRATGVSRKMAGYSVKASTDADFAGTLNVFDANFHEWIAKIDDTTYTMWVDGEELFSVPVHAAMLKPKYLIANHALDVGHGDRVPASSEVFDMVFDYVEVMQSNTDLAVVATGFSALPTIAGYPFVGQTLTATPNTVGTQLEYRWYRDGVPIVTATASTYVVQSADIGHALRVHVKNLSLVNQPEAWAVATAAATDIEAETTTLLAAMTVQPDNTRKGVINARIKQMKDTGIWAKQDLYYEFAAHDRQAAKLNWKAPGSFALTEVGGTVVANVSDAITFTVDRGFAGNGVAGYLNTAYLPSGSGVQLVQNSAHLAYGSQSAASSAGIQLGSRTTSSTGQLMIAGRNASDTVIARINIGATAGITPANTDGSGLFTGCRSASGAWKAFRNGTSLGTDTTPSTAKNAVALTILALNTGGVIANFTTTQIDMVSVGANLTDQNVADLSAGRAAYNAAVGAI